MPGKLSEVYEGTLSFAEEIEPHLVEHLAQTFGFAIGLELRDRSMIIEPKYNVIVKRGMIFNVNVGAPELTNQQENEHTPATVLTQPDECDEHF